MTDRAVVHTFNPEHPVTQGIDTVVRDVVKFSAADDNWWIVGIHRPEQGRDGLGRWRTVEMSGRPVQFMPVAALDTSDQRRVVPHSWRLATGLARRRPRLPGTVHVHRPDIGAAVASLYPRTPAVFWSHTSTSAALGRDSDSIWRHFRPLYGLVEGKLLRSSSAIVAAGEPERQRLEAQRPGLCHALPSWYDDTIFRPRTEARDRGPLRIAWAGRLEAPKDPLLAVGVAEALRSRDTDVVLDVFGSGTLEGEVRDAVRRAGLDGSVVLHGSLPREQLARHLAESDVLLMTSHFEGAPRILVEALACGTPVAGPAAIDPDNVITPGTGRVVPSREPAELARAVLAAAELDRGAVHRHVQDRGASVLVPRLLEDLETSRPAHPRRGMMG
jgi:glycosyltransferase involved in cell wall biosynthesis